MARSTSDTHDDELDPQAPEETDGSAAEADTGAGETGGDAGALQAEIDSLKSRLLRATADYQNQARRASQDVSQAREQQLFEVAKGLVGILDLFDQALAVDPKKVTAESLQQGVEMVRSEFIKLLDRFNIQRIEANPGDEFDPKRHEALMRQPAEGVEPNRIAVQLQPGYTLGERTVRPVKVSVADETR